MGRMRLDRILRAVTDLSVLKHSDEDQAAVNHSSPFGPVSQIDAGSQIESVGAWWRVTNTL